MHEITWPEGRSTNMKALFRISVGMVAAFIAFSVWWSLPTAESLRAKRVTLAALSLPIGSTKQQVTVLLHRESLNASYVSDKEGLDYGSDLRNNGYSSANLSGYYTAIVRNSSRSFIGEADTCYFFFFDKKGRLLKATSQEEFVGL